MKIRLIVISALCFSCLSVAPSILLGGESKEKQRSGDASQRDRGERSKEGRKRNNRAKREGGERRGGPRMMQMLPVLRALDADGDGKISAEEISNASVALRSIDNNGDGQLTMDELRPSGRPGVGPGGNRKPPAGDRKPGEKMRKGERPDGAGRFGGPAQMFEKLDKNGDGLLSPEEARGPLKKRFEMIDNDGDGSISQSEMMEAGKEMEARRNRFRENDAAPGGDRPRRPPVE